MSYNIENQALGEHEVTVESHGITVKGDTVTINFRFKFLNGEIGNKDFYPFSSEKSNEITRKAIRAMGFDIDRQDIEDLQNNQVLLAGVKVRATVEEQEYKGQVNNRITWINPIKVPPSKEVMKALTLRLRAAKKSTPNTSEEL